MKSWAANALWLASVSREARRFWQATKQVEQTQRILLERIIFNSANETAFGRDHDLIRVKTIADYQQRVPLLDYDDYLPYIDRAAAGEPNVLDRAPITLFEPTSGSTAATKLIPYTKDLKARFNRGIAPWIANLFTHRPGLMGGQAYWSVSPVVDGQRYTEGGIPIGFEDDTDYLGGAGRIVRQIMAVPSAVKLIGNIESFRYVTMLFLLRAAELRIVSVWNPTFMSLLLDTVDRHAARLVRDIHDGTLSPPHPIDDDVQHALVQHLKPNPMRANAIEDVLSVEGATPFRRIWPHLGLLSCWADGAASAPASSLSKRLPQALLQGKGLIATEAFVSVPTLGDEGGLLAIRSHFFEFQTDGGDIVLAHQLERGQTYRVVVTNGAGLYRYQLHDLVESLGGLRIRFIGRSANISDQFGEKVSEGHVASIINNLYQHPPDFCLLSPEKLPDGQTAYILFTTAQVVPHQLESALCRNFHYAYCRKLGQLQPAQVRVAGDNAAELYLQACIARGQRAGDVKVPILDRRGGLLSYFDVGNGA
jgi:hypothetical protein